MLKTLPRSADPAAILRQGREHRLEHESLAAGEWDLIEHRGIHPAEALGVVGREVNERLDPLPRGP